MHLDIIYTMRDIFDFMGTGILFKTATPCYIRIMQNTLIMLLDLQIKTINVLKLLLELAHCGIRTSKLTVKVISIIKKA